MIQFLYGIFLVGYREYDSVNFTSLYLILKTLRYGRFSQSRSHVIHIIKLSVKIIQSHLLVL